ncbi:hypothetical protein [Desulfobotulus mexicanus]|uniref:Uncharacterized protein n=1 Tax=Desulfobotulus mexicanus TaxID=2586642 RepID=A0A5S5MD40_9BACT|nr:hypothetical protein [Desulfobotulus mexicanus]TYT73545.1 hypothetical protein FIM25_14550 [Desulfobotulus mexicanus]
MTSISMLVTFRSGGCMEKQKGSSCHICKMALLVLVLVIIMGGCATRNQVLWHKTAAVHSANIVPGVEAEEAAAKIVVRVRGQGLAPEEGSPARRRYNAERAAVLDGYRQLSERIAGFILDSYTMSGEGDMSHDRIVAETRAYVRGAQIMEVAYAEGMATAEMRVFLAPRTSIFQWDGRIANR